MLFSPIEFSWCLIYYKLFFYSYNFLAESYNTLRDSYNNDVRKLAGDSESLKSR